MTLSGAFSWSKPQPQFAPELPRHRSTLDDPHHLAAEPVLDHWPPRHQCKFVGVLNQRELAARELDGLLEDALHRLAIAGSPKRQGPRGSECGAGADDIALFECGEQVAAVENPAVAMADSVALPDQVLAPAIEPGRAVSFDLPFQVEGRKHANVELAISSGIIGRGPALKILRETPMVGVDPLDDPGPAQRLEPADMGVDEAVMVATGNAALEPGLLQMAARPIDAVLRHAGNGAIGRTATCFGRSDLGDAADTDVFDSSRIDAGNVVGAAVDAIDGEG